MKTLYFECNMGAAGDMLMASLYELMDEGQKEYFLAVMNRLMENVEVVPSRAKTRGIAGTSMEVIINGLQEGGDKVDDKHSHDHSHKDGDGSMHSHAHSHDGEHEREHPHGHSHAAPQAINQILGSLELPQEVINHAQAVYDTIADAESKAHGVPVTRIHFHEVGNKDAIADITGVCLAIHILSPDRIIASPIHVGSGHVHCAHGILPVPAPATAYILEGVPYYTGAIDGELCTPTGAALIRHYARSFGSMPVMTMKKIGYGIGKKNFPAANCVRAFLGETDDTQIDEIIEICCYIDDMTAEALAYAGERIMDAGALDIASAHVTMKKGRPGFQFTVLCKSEDEERIAKSVLRETTTNGVRVRRCKRYILTPGVDTIETEYGCVRIKHADGDDIHHIKPEYEDVAEIARKTGKPFDQVWKEILMEAAQVQNARFTSLCNT